MFEWDSLTTEEKEKQLLKDIEFQLSENKNIDKTIKERLIQNYTEYIKQYIKYYKETDYLNTLLSSRYIKIKNIIINYNILFIILRLCAVKAWWWAGFEEKTKILEFLDEK